MFGFQLVATAAGQPVADRALKPVPLSATQSAATIYNGTNQVLPERIVENNATTIANTSTYDINPNVDSANYAFAISPLDDLGRVGPLCLSCLKVTPPFNVGGTTDRYNALENLGYQLKTSSAPVFLSCKDINMSRTRGLSHTLFTNIAWQFNVCDSWEPYFGLGAAFEIGKTSCSNCCDSSMCCVGCCDNRCTPGTNSCCNSCIDCAVSQWSVWLKGGVAFGNV